MSHQCGFEILPELCSSPTVTAWEALGWELVQEEARAQQPLLRLAGSSNQSFLASRKAHPTCFHWAQWIFLRGNSAFTRASRNLFVFGLLSNEGIESGPWGSCLSPELRSSRTQSWQRGGVLLALTRCPVLYTNPPLLICLATDMAVSEILQHRTCKNRSPLAVPLFGSFATTHPRGVSICHPTCQQPPEELGNPNSELVCRKFVGHCKYFLAYHFAHTSVQRWHYPWIFMLSF